MPHYILHHDNLYFEWSTVVDAPISPAMTLAEFLAYYEQQYGVNQLANLPNRLKRANEFGCSAIPPMTIQECVIANRAGSREKALTFDELMAYVKETRVDYGLAPFGPTGDDDKGDIDG